MKGSSSKNGEVLNTNMANSSSQSKSKIATSGINQTSNEHNIKYNIAVKEADKQNPNYNKYLQ